jgi:hypothetical protein
MMMMLTTGDRIGEGRMDLNEARLLLDLGGFAETKIFSRTRELAMCGFHL